MTVDHPDMAATEAAVHKVPMYPNEGPARNAFLTEEGTVSGDASLSAPATTTTTENGAPPKNGPGAGAAFIISGTPAPRAPTPAAPAPAASAPAPAHAVVAPAPAAAAIAANPFTAAANPFATAATASTPAFAMPAMPAATFAPPRAMPPPPTVQPVRHDPPAPMPAGAIIGGTAPGQQRAFIEMVKPSAARLPRQLEAPAPLLSQIPPPPLINKDHNNIKWLHEYTQLRGLATPEYRFGEARDGIDTLFICHVTVEGLFALSFARTAKKEAKHDASGNWIAQHINELVLEPSPEELLPRNITWEGSGRPVNFTDPISLLYQWAQAEYLDPPVFTFDRIETINRGGRAYRCFVTLSGESADSGEDYMGKKAAKEYAARLIAFKLNLGPEPDKPSAAPPVVEEEVVAAPAMAAAYQPEPILVDATAVDDLAHQLAQTFANPLDRDPVMYSSSGWRAPDVPEPVVSAPEPVAVAATPAAAATVVEPAPVYAAPAPPAAATYTAPTPAPVAAAAVVAAPVYAAPVPATYSAPTPPAPAPAPVAAAPYIAAAAPTPMPQPQPFVAAPVTPSASVARSSPISPPYPTDASPEIMAEWTKDNLESIADTLGLELSFGRANRGRTRTVTLGGLKAEAPTEVDAVLLLCGRLADLINRGDV
ncbi:hypothetical protein BC828DRAFT_395235 [Blastocladiella britannica]|nr:hypothetical protein BC828DRAFT_395235 [Blastocladiella britannica]